MSTRRNDRKPSRTRCALLVLGMHRSGTSALGGVLAHLGASTPRTLMEANEYNERGYWESAKMMQVHDALLRSAGSRWNDWGRFNPDWLESPVAPEFEERLAREIESEFDGSPFFVVKDPRISRFLPVWLRALDKAGIEPKVIIPVRNPLEVARSLANRNHFGRSKSMLLWLRHMLDAEFSSRNVSRSFLHYERLLGDWEQEVTRIAAELDIKWPKWSDDVATKISDYLSTDLRHNVADTAAEGAAGEVNEWVNETYRLLAGFSTGQPQDAAAFRELDRIRDRFDETSNIYGAVVREHENRVEGLYADIKAKLEAESKRAHGLESELGEMNDRSRTERAELEEALKQAEVRRERENEQGVVALDRATAELAAVSRDRDGLRDALTRQANDHGEQVALLKQAKAEHKARVEAAFTEISGLQERLARREREFEEQVALSKQATIEHEAAVAAISGELSELQERLARRDQEFEEQAALLKQAESDRDEASARTSELEDQVARKASDLSMLKASLAEADASVEQRFEETAKLTKLVLDLESKVAKRDAAIKRLNIEARAAGRQSGRMALLARFQLASKAASLERLNAGVSSLREYATALGSGQANVIRRMGGVLRFGKSVGPVPGVMLDDDIISSQVELLNQSDLFDGEWYAANHPEVAKSGLDPAEHYLREGVFAGLNPSRKFDTFGYLVRYKDVRRVGGNPLVHYIQFGAKEGRLTTPEGKN